MPGTTSAKTNPQNATSEAPRPKCRVVQQPDGGLQVSFLIEPQEAARLVKRAYKLPLDIFIWENMLKQGISSLVY